MCHLSRLIAPFLFSFCCILNLNAQHPACGTDDLLQQKLASDPVFKEKHEALEQQRVQFLKEKEAFGEIQKSSLAAYTIPVVVHIIHQNGPENISDAQVQQGIQQMNAAFANTGYYDNGDGTATPFQFCLAKRKPDGTSTTGINRVVSPLTDMIKETEDAALKDLSRWDPTQYVNIWVVAEISSQSSGSGVAGYAYLPSAHGATYDGIVMEANWFGSNPGNTGVLIHEMGHYLGLYHTFEGGCTNNDCTQDGDRVCDTPPDQSTAWTPCGTVQNTCSTDVNSGFATDQNDMTINYMDYATLSCYNAFTTGQSDRMEYFLLNVRQSLLDSKGCLDACSMPSAASFTTSAGPTVNVGTTVNFVNTSLNGNGYEWHLNGAQFATSINTIYTFSNAGTFVVALFALNAELGCGDSASYTFTVVCPVTASFNLASQTLDIGEAVTLNGNGSAGANTFRWLVDGVPVANTATHTLSFSTPGLRTVCLVAANAICRDTMCVSVEVVGPPNCSSTFEKGWRTNFFQNPELAFNELDSMPDGKMIAAGNGQNLSPVLAIFSAAGNLEKSWLLQSGVLTWPFIDLAVTDDGHIVGIQTVVASSGTTATPVHIFKFNYNTGQLVWRKQLSYTSSVYVWKVLQHPVSKNYIVWGVSSESPPSAAYTHTFVWELSPINASLLSEHKYLYPVVPQVRSAVAVNDKIIGCGWAGDLALSTAAICQHGADGAIEWLRHYNFQDFPNGGRFSEIVRDGNSLALNGVVANRVFLMKTDLSGGIVWSKIFAPNNLTGVFTHDENVELDVLPDGYLMSHQDNGIVSGTTRFYFTKLGKDGTFVFSKTLDVPIDLAGLDVVVKGRYAYAVSGVFSGGDSYLYKIDLEATGDSYSCAPLQDFSLQMSDLTVTPTLVTPVLQNNALLSFQDVATTVFPNTLLGFQPCQQSVCPEICDNGLDDDFDGLVDCYDPADCPCDNDTLDCALSTDVQNPVFSARPVWQSIGNKVSSTGGFLVGNLNPSQDTIPEIIVFKSRYAPFTFYARHLGLLIFRGDGSNALTPDELPIPEEIINRRTMFSLADVNNDGIPELIATCSDRRIRVYTNYQPGATPAMQLMAISAQTVPDEQVCPYLADFDADGFPEIYAGNEIFAFNFSVPAFPTLSRIATGGVGPAGKRHTGATIVVGASPIAADLLSVADCNGDPDCDGLEIAAGYGIYSVDLSTTDGDPRQVKLQRDLNVMTTGSSFSDGATALADMNLDGVPEILVAGRRNAEWGMYLWNKNGFVHFFPLVGPLNSTPWWALGPMTVSNVYDDKSAGAATDLPELITPVRGKLVAYNLNKAIQTPSTPYWWSLPTDDASGISGATAFDLDGDGQTEVIFRGQETMRILYGGAAPFPPGVDGQRNRAIFPVVSGTIEEHPLVADVDKDGEAEIVITGGDDIINGGYQIGNLRVFKSDPAIGTPWVPARSVWNQHNYHVVNVNDDLSIPANQQPGHVETPAGSGKYPLNTFLCQRPLRDKAFGSNLPVPDALVSAGETVCLGDSLRVRLEVCNYGSAALTAGTPLRLYLGDPTQTAATMLPATPVLPTDVDVDSCISLHVIIPNLTSQTVYVVVNDDGSKPTPFNLATDFPVGSILECDYLNNKSPFQTPEPPPTVDLGPDIAVCQNGVWTFDAGPDFASYKWSTQSNERSVTIYEPGTYWVEVKDFCGNAQRDTVTVVVDAATLIELGPDTVLCSGAALQLNVGGFVEYQWLPADGLSCTACPNPNAQPSGNVTYTVLAKTPLGCISTDSIRVTLSAPAQAQLDTAVCAGNTLTLHGVDIPAGGSQVLPLTTQAGCDSMLTVIVAALPTFQTTENQAVCAGDSILIFNQWQNQAGIFSKIFVAQNGCDSTHGVELNVVPEFQTSENQTICAGDSILIFNEWQNQAGVFSKIFTTSGGCDSTHSVALDVLPKFQTSENQAICAGDSILIFNQWQTQAGIFSKNFTAQNGCDSAHTVALDILPVFQTLENQTICAGDSILIFNEWRTQAGVFSKIFSAQNGCDSAHTVVLDVLPEFQTSEARAICAGDSALIFNQWQSQAGIFSQMFSSASGCDSLHSVALSVVPEFQTSESQAICAGDSILIFNEWRTQAGVFSKIFAASGGCDSTHTVALDVLPKFQTSESQTICAGDSVLIFNEWQTQVGIFSKIFNAQNGCDSTHTFALSVLPEFQTSVSQSICTGDSVLIFNQWQTQAGVFNQIFAAQNGCDSTHTVTLEVVPAFQTVENLSVCAGDSILIFNQWQTQAGVFSQTFSSAGGCDSTHTVMLEQIPPPAVGFEATPPDCFGGSNGSIDAPDAPPGLTYSLDGVNFQSLQTFENLPAGTYTVHVRDATGCLFLETITLSAPAPLTLSLPADQLVEPGQSVQLQPSVSAGALTFNWSPPTFLDCATCPNPVATPYQSTVYTLTVQNSQGCTATDDIALTVKEKAVQVFVPNIFSPNDDGENELLAVFAPSGVREVTFMEVYDRWGGLLFRREHFAPDGTVGWDGHSQGKLLTPGVYVWSLELELEDGSKRKMSGDVTLVR